MPDCSCRGVNYNCSRCSGTGFIGRLGNSRQGSVSDVIRELKSISARPGRRARLPKNKQPPISTPILTTILGSTPTRPASQTYSLCPICGTKLRQDRRQGHIDKRCPKLKFQPQATAAEAGSSAKRKRRATKKQPLAAKAARSARRSRYTESSRSRQEQFENSFLPGGLCNGR